VVIAEHDDELVTRADEASERAKDTRVASDHFAELALGLVRPRSEPELALFLARLLLVGRQETDAHEVDHVAVDDEPPGTSIQSTMRIVRQEIFELTLEQRDMPQVAHRVGLDVLAQMQVGEHQDIWGL